MKGAQQAMGHPPPERREQPCSRRACPGLGIEGGRGQIRDSIRDEGIPFPSPIVSLNSVWGSAFGISMAVGDRGVSCLGKPRIVKVFSDWQSGDAQQSRKRSLLQLLVLSLLRAVPPRGFL